jgi:hypothetical protein
MTADDWFAFIASGAPRIVSVTRLPLDLCRYVDVL